MADLKPPTSAHEPEKPDFIGNNRFNRLEQPVSSPDQAKIIQEVHKPESNKNEKYNISSPVAKVANLDESIRKSRANTRLYEHPRPSDLNRHTSYQIGWPYQ